MDEKGIAVGLASFQSCHLMYNRCSPVREFRESPSQKSGKWWNFRFCLLRGEIKWHFFPPIAPSILAVLFTYFYLHI
jgi:hypothetical protein